MDIEAVRQSEWERNAYRKSMTCCRCAHLELLTNLVVGCAVLITYEYCEFTLLPFNSVTEASKVLQLDSEVRTRRSSSGIFTYSA